MKAPVVYIGVDVSKDQLDVHVPEGKTFRVANTAAGVRRLFARLDGVDGTVQVCLEATGGYERLLMEACWLASIPVARLNAWHIRCYAQSQGMLAKTDRLDARMIAAFAAHRKPDPTPQPPAWRAELREIWTLRAHLILVRSGDTARLEHEREAICRRTVREHIGWLDRRIAKLETRAHAIIASQPEAAALVSRFRLVKAIGLTTAITLLVEAPELGTLGPKRVAALAGLAPMCDDSGHHKGPRRIQRGRFTLRRALYMSALVAARYNPILAAFYRRLISAGKKPKLALVAVMRKLIVLLDRIAGDPDFVPSGVPT